MDDADKVKLDMQVPKLETLADGLEFLQPMMEKYVHDKGLDSEGNVLLIKRHLARRKDEIRRMGEGCRTIGDLKRRICERYAGFAKTIEKLSHEEPSIARLERIAKALAEAFLLSGRYQDSSVTLCPALGRAFDLLIERPKTPKGNDLTGDGFLFSKNEVARVVRAASQIVEAFATYLRETQPVTLPFELHLPPGHEYLMKLKDMKKEDRAAAALFEEVKPGRSRYRAETVRLFKTAMGNESEMLELLPDEILDKSLAEAIETLSGDQFLSMALAFAPAIMESVGSFDPTLFDVRKDKMLEEMVWGRAVEFLEKSWNNLEENEKVALQLVSEIEATPAPTGKLFDRKAEMLRRCKNCLISIRNNKEKLRDGFRRAGRTPPDEVDVPQQVASKPKVAETPPTAEKDPVPQPRQEDAPKNDVEKSDAEACSLRTEHYHRFTVEWFASGLKVTDEENFPTKPYFITPVDGNAAKAALVLIRDYGAGNEQTHRSSRKWIGAFQSGRGDATRFRDDQIFKFPKWSAEKGRFLPNQYDGRWRLWTDDEMQLTEEKRLANFKAAHPHGYGVS